MSTPNRSKPARRGRVKPGRRGLLIAVTIAVVLIGLGYVAVRERRDPRFIVSFGDVSGIARTSRAQVIQATDLATNQNAWLIDRRATSTRIERLPWVLRARLSVHWPNKLNVTIKERKPVAFVVLGAANGEEPLPSYALIDDMQRVLQLTDRRSADVQGLALLIVTPPPAGDVQPGSSLSNRSVAQALQALARLRALGVHVSEIAIAPSTGISALADRNLRVLFGEEADLAKKAALFQAIVAKISEPARIAYIDVRSVHTPTVLYW